MSDVERPANESGAIAWLVERVPELRALLERRCLRPAPPYKGIIDYIKQAVPV